MRSVEKKFNAPPPELKACADVHMSDLLKQKERHKFDYDCYNKTTRDALLDLYHNRCAYCESKILVSSYLTIDHFRPKKRYYWLAYEWSNLLPACQRCNTTKSIHFPRRYQKAAYSENALAANSAELLAEGPLLLHPEIDNTEDYFTFGTDGTMAALNNIPEANVTIEVLQLNWHALKKDRKHQIDDIYYEIIERTVMLKEIIELAGDVHQIISKHWQLIKMNYVFVFEKLKRLKTPGENQGYTLLGNFMYKYFTCFFLHKIEDVFLMQFLAEVFMRLKKEKL